MNTPVLPTPNLVGLGSIKLFDVMGLKGSEQEEKVTADEISDSLWQQFLAEDVMDQLSEEALDDLQKILNDKELEAKPNEQTQKMITIVEQFVPDMKGKLSQKALEFKKEIVMERVAGLRDKFAEDTDTLAKIDQVESFANDGKWNEAIQLLNQVSPLKE
jgi:hypothetical protein